MDPEIPALIIHISDLIGALQLTQIKKQDILYFLGLYLDQPGSLFLHQQRTEKASPRRAEHQRKGLPSFFSKAHEEDLTCIGDGTKPLQDLSRQELTAQQTSCSI